MSQVRDRATLYRDIWKLDPHYGTASEWVADTVDHRIAPYMRRCATPRPCIVVDWGAGDGRYLWSLRARGIASQCIGVDFHRPIELPPWIQWHQGDMASLTAQGDFAISADALEHAPLTDIPAILTNMRQCAPHGWARISLIDDPYGPRHGMDLELHEAVLPASEWLRLLKQAGMVIAEFRVYYEHGDERALEVGW